MLYKLLVIISGLALSTASMAADFETCKDRLAHQAKARFAQPEAVATIFEKIEAVPRVIASDRKQAEFTHTFTDYFAARVSERRIETGRKMRQQHAELLGRIYRDTGVQPHYLLAFWGLETNFGGYMGKLDVPSALATLACDTRRSQFFKDQLMAVVDLLLAGDMRQEQLVGSWAGAMGHMQFMPTTYQAHAVDGDGDGRRDVYGSLADAWYSAANYLKNIGWKPGYRWGREVLLPEGFDLSLAHDRNWQSLAQWRELGVTDTRGRRLPALDLEGAILLPASGNGPAFLIYSNFNVIMKWNRSTNYALTVGALADRIAGMGRLHTPLPDSADLRVATDTLIKAQTRLNEIGLDTGTPDGVLGRATRAAIRQYQIQLGLPADGHPHPAVLRALLDQGE